MPAQGNGMAATQLADDQLRYLTYDRLLTSSVCGDGVMTKTRTKAEMGTPVTAHPHVGDRINTIGFEGERFQQSRSRSGWQDRHRCLFAMASRY